MGIIHRNNINNFEQFSAVQNIQYSIFKMSWISLQKHEYNTNSLLLNHFPINNQTQTILCIYFIFDSSLAMRIFLQKSHNATDLNMLIKLICLYVVAFEPKALAFSCVPLFVTFFILIFINLLNLAQKLKISSANLFSSHFKLNLFEYMNGKRSSIVFRCRSIESILLNYNRLTRLVALSLSHSLIQLFFSVV